MFENLSSRLSGAFEKLRGRGRLTEENIADALREVRTALLEADVGVPVVRSFIESVRVRALGQEVLKSLTPDQALVRVVRDELTRLMGEANDSLRLNVQPPAVVLIAGLQGSGKTTSTAKLARLLKERERKSVMVVSCDVYRPAAIEQLRTLAGEVGVDCFATDALADPVDIATEALADARRRAKDVLLVDTAGRLHVDETMMAEIARLHRALEPVETLFVVDAMTGQDAVRVAEAFDHALPLTGVILTKADGDARGGAALSIRQVTGKPIKFLGVGEKTGALEPFHPDRMASRILGMGDVLTLIEEAERKIDRDKAEQLAQKMRKGAGFGFDDFRDQIREMSKLGGIAGLIDKLPGMDKLPNQAVGMGDKELRRFDAIICSMTPQERRFPALLKGSRKRRIALGSGCSVADVNRLLKQFTQMQKMMKRMGKKGGLARMMQGARGAAPPGLFRGPR